MQAHQFLPLSELMSALSTAAERESNAKIPAIPWDLADDDELVVSEETGVVREPAEPSVSSETQAGKSDEWLDAQSAAKKLEITVRHLRRLATAGKVKRRKKDDGKTRYCIAPWLAERAAITEDTAVAAAPAAPESGDPSATGEHLAVSSETGATPKLEVKAGPETGAVPVIAIGDDDVIEIDEIDLVTDAIVAEELVNTNRELMRLIDGMLNRWSDVHSEQSRSSDNLREAMKDTLEVQQCLQHWQHHASLLERQILETSHVAIRALDVADEALATRWTSGSRRRILVERLSGLRRVVEGS